jgi:hypothetical protein
MSRLFNPTTAIITWMSNPACPSLVWQIYDYSLEPFGSYFAVQKASEQVHIMMTQDDFKIVLVNHTPAPLKDMKYRLRILNLDGSVKFDETAAIPAAPASAALELRTLPTPAGLSAVHFVKLELMDSNGKAVSDNFYWKEMVEDDLRALDTIPDVELEGRVSRRDAGGNCQLELKLSNPTRNIAVMAHVQLRNQRTNQRVLPVYYSENYVSLLPGESRTITIEASLQDLGGARLWWWWMAGTSPSRRWISPTRAAPASLPTTMPACYVRWRETDYAVHGLEGLGELRSPGQAEAYPTWMTNSKSLASTCCPGCTSNSVTLPPTGA